MATFRKRKGPNGRPVCQAQIIRQGFPHQFRTFDTCAEARSWARRVESEMDAGSWQDRSEGDRTTIREGLARYLVEIVPHGSPTTLRASQNRVRRLQKSSLAPVSLSRATGKDVANFIRTRERGGAGANTIRLDLAIVSHLYTVARGPWGMPYLVNPVPLAATARPKLPPGRERRLRGGLAGGEETRLLAAASPEFAAVIRFALASAMRRGEIAAMRWEDVDLKRRTVLLPKTKNRRVRNVPLSPVGLEILGHLPRRIDGSVFGVSANAITLSWKRTVMKAGITGLTFHDLRHESISRLFEDTDLDIMEIREISGHKTLQQLVRYTHLRTARLAGRLAGASRT